MNYLEKILLIMIILLVRKKLIGMCIPDTPCPSIFLYKYQKNFWHGELTILVPDPSTEIVKLEVTYFSRIPIKNRIDNSLDKLSNEQEFASNIKYGRPITYILSFPFPNDPPRIGNITLNGNIICAGAFDDDAVAIMKVHKIIKVTKTIERIQVGLDGKPVTNRVSIQQQLQQLQQHQEYLQQLQQQQFLQQQQQQQYLQQQQQQQQYLQQQPQQYQQEAQQYQQEAQQHQQEAQQNLQQPQQHLQQEPQQPNINENRVYTPNDPSNVCGTESEGPKVVQLIVNGEFTEKPPWLVALFDNDAQTPKFFCAGSLISIRFIVTAAHCTFQKKYILIKLGGIDVSTIHEPGSFIRVSDTIRSHSEYRSQSSNADISVVKMSEPVYFNNNIKPICMWPNTHLEEPIIVNRDAVIFGWGNDEYGHLTLSAPRKTNLTIKSYAECKEMPLLDNVISDKTICATSVNTISGPCLGDSGGGLYIKIKNKWIIRGIISAAIGKESSRMCDVQNYFSVYTDTGKYFNWINDMVNTL